MPRHARAPEVPDVAALYHAVWHETQAPFMPAEECARRDTSFFVDRMTKLLSTTLVEERDGMIVGFSSWSAVLLGQVFVSTRYRGTTVAPDLMTATEQMMRAEGVAEAELHCVVGNHRARRFYERMGWQHRGEILEYVAGPSGDAGVPFWRMTKSLGVG